MSMKRGALAAILLSNLAVPKAHALGFTPQGVCAKAGFGKESSFHETCVSRVFKERRAAFWRENGPQILLGGLVAGASAATGGTAFGFMSRKADPQVASFDVGGLIFLVRVVGVEATVRPGPNIKNIKQIDPQAWERVVETATGCSATNRVCERTNGCTCGLNGA